MITKPRSGFVDDPLHPLSKGCVCHLLMNEGTGSLAYDVSGHGNHGKLKNMLPNTQGSGWGGSKFGGGLSFDGTNDYVDCGNDSSLNITDAITIEAWVKPDSDGTGNRRVPIATGAGGGDTGWGFEVEADNSLVFEIFGSLGGRQLFNSVDSLTTDIFHHIVFIFDRNALTLRIFLNSVEMTLDTNSVTEPGDIVYSSDLTIGLVKHTSTYIRHFNGSIDGVKIYNRALSAEEVKQSYINPFCNLISIPIWKRLSLAGLHIPTAMHYYKRLRV